MTGFPPNHSYMCYWECFKDLRAYKMKIYNTFLILYSCRIQICSYGLSGKLFFHINQSSRNCVLAFSSLYIPPLRIWQSRCLPSVCWMIPSKRSSHWKYKIIRPFFPAMIQDSGRNSTVLHYHHSLALQ